MSEQRNYKFGSWCDPTLKQYEVYDLDTREVVAKFPYTTELSRGTASAHSIADRNERNEQWRAAIAKAKGGAA